MRIGLQSSTLQYTSTSNETTSNFELLNKWRIESPDIEREERNNIYEKIIEANHTGTLSITASNVTSIPAFPDKLSELTLSSCFALESIPPLPDGLKFLTISENRNIKISHFPDSLESVSIDMHAYDESCHFPALPYELKSFTACYGKFLPPLPPYLSSLSLQHFHEILCTELPCGLDKLDLQSCPFSPLMEMLPVGLKELSIVFIRTANDTVIDDILPENLKKLSINFCDNIKLPSKLPVNLESISLSSMTPIEWEIQTCNLPAHLDITTDGYVKLKPEFLTRNDITFSHKLAKDALSFQSGDVVYGLCKARERVNTLINSLYEFSEKDIVIQNTLTDAVWDRMRGNVFSNDEKIAKKLNDIQRGVFFREFLSQHQKYNITDDKFSDLSNEERWIKTSKAGLEFQTRLRERSVIFVVDNLVDAITDIANKTGKHGNAITAHELRWIYRNRHDDLVKQNVKFFLNGESISHEDIFSLVGWKQYKPKNGA
ncbi:type III secretion system protein [Salmonella bongori]|uniref:type III secretion system protein n=1 Tax=Salmonella bongori TaxID=54736 RepID=UPI0009AA9375|nr:type III secretion system protein [Salmonella bongori]